jgi:hypothetical protein
MLICHTISNQEQESLIAAVREKEKTDAGALHSILRLRTRP